MRYLNLALVIILLSGCSKINSFLGKEKSSFSNVKVIDGPYNGNLYENGQLSGTLHLDFTQSGTDLNGVYDLLGKSSGTISGTLNYDTSEVEFVFTQSFPCSGIYQFGGIHRGFIDFKLQGQTGCLNINGNGTIVNVNPTRFP